MFANEMKADPVLDAVAHENMGQSLDMMLRRVRLVSIIREPTIPAEDQVKNAPVKDRRGGGTRCAGMDYSRFR